MKRILVLSLLALLLVPSCRYEAISPDEFEETGLAQLHIQTKGHELIKNTDDWVKCTLRFVAEDGTVTTGEENEDEVKGRGNSSWGIFESFPPKKPYNIKFKTANNLFPVATRGYDESVRKYALLANSDDPTLLKNNLAFFISREVGMPYTMDSLSIDLFINDVYNGNYLMTYHHQDIAQMLSFDESDANFGYLLEVDYKNSQIVSEIYGLEADAKLTDDAGKIESIRQDIAKLEAQLAAGDCSGFDLPSFAKYWVVESFIGNSQPTEPDSMFLYKTRMDGKLFAGPIWDSNEDTFDDPYADMDLSDCLYWKTLFAASPEFRTEVKKAWASIDLEAIGAYLLQQKEHIRRSWKENRKVWGTQTVWLNEQYTTLDGYCSGMIRTMKLRYAWMDDYIRNL